MKRNNSGNREAPERGSKSLPERSYRNVEGGTRERHCGDQSAAGQNGKVGAKGTAATRKKSLLGLGLHDMGGCRGNYGMVGEKSSGRGIFETAATEAVLEGLKSREEA